MRHKKLVIFVALIAGGVFVVWLLGVREGENLLGGRRRPPATSNGPSPFENRDPNADVALRDATIPVHSPSKDDPNVMVLRYVIRIGETVGDVARRTHAKRVNIDLYNGKPKPEERAVAKVKSDEAELVFATAPDATTGFRDAALETMSLQKNVVVDYLDDQGNAQARLDCDQLDVTDTIFHVPGHAIVTQEGMRVEGDGLVYHKDGGAFSFEKNVHVEGTQFGLPTPTASTAGDATETKTLKTIDCKGVMTFVPSDKKREKSESAPKSVADAGGAIPTDANFGSLKGGVLTFHDDVVGKQETSTLTAQVLEVTLSSAPPVKSSSGDSNATAKKASGMQVNHAVATGASGRPAVLDDPQGRLEGEVLILDRGAEGQVVVLQKSAKILNARMGGTGDASKVLNAGASTEIRFHPDSVGNGEATAAGGLGSAQKVRLELKDDAWLETKGAQPSDDLHIEGQRLDLEFAKTGGASDSLQLRHLTATGGAKGVIPQGTFTGDEIVVAPKEAAPDQAPGDSQDFVIHIQPNPAVQLVSDLPGGGKREVHVASTGRLDYQPATSDTQGGVATFTGKTNLTVAENGAITSTLDATKSLTIELNPDGSSEALKSMVAVGDVHFDSPQQRIKGVGDRLRLEPGSKGSQTFNLYGAPAVAYATDAGGKENVVHANEVRFDPDEGTMHALGNVDARFTGIALAQPDAGSAPAANQGTLRCEDLTVFVPADGGPTTLIAKTHVRFDDPDHAIFAKSAEMHYSEATKIATFDGPPDDQAEVTRTVAATADAAARSLTVAGPRIILDQVTSILTCPIRGRVTIDRGAAKGVKGAKDQRISAWSDGPVRYVNDRLILRDNVVVAFDEDDTEVRSLRADLATVYFAEKAGSADAPVASSDPSGLGGVGGTGVDRILAEGRVHLEQSVPNDLIADGQSLEWIGSDQDETTILVGTSPKSTVIQRMGKQRLRYDADRFVMHNTTGAIETENGFMTFID